jgi:hypothetical protein
MALNSDSQSADDNIAEISDSCNDSAAHAREALAVP